MRLCSYSVEPGPPRLGADCGRAVLDLARYSHLHDGLRLPSDMLGLLDAGAAAWRHAADLCRRFSSELESHDLTQDAEAGLAYASDRIRFASVKTLRPTPRNPAALHRRRRFTSQSRPPPSSDPVRPSLIRRG